MKELSRTILLSLVSASGLLFPGCLLLNGGCVATGTMDKLIASSVDDLKRVTQIGFDRLDAHDEHMTRATMALATSAEVKAEMTAFAVAYAATTEDQDAKLEDIHSSVGTLITSGSILGILGIGGVGGNAVGKRRKPVAPG